VEQRQQALARSLRDPLARRRLAFEARHAALLRTSPHALIVNARQRVDDLLRRAQATSAHDLTFKREALTGLAQALRVMGPASVLNRGYAVVQRTDDGTVIRSIDQVSSGDALEVLVGDGKFGVEVAKKMKAGKP
jgi:exodeoxyribonuclease VII large subunit